VANGVLIFLCLPVYVLLVDIKEMALPHAALPLAFDGLWILFSFCGGIAGAASSVLDHCEYYDLVAAAGYDKCVSCGTLKAAIAFTFFLFGLFCVSLFLSFRKMKESDPDVFQFGNNAMTATPGVDAQRYNESATPTNVPAKTVDATVV
jgi:hypothetical protein